MVIAGRVGTRGCNFHFHRNFSWFGEENAFHLNARGCVKCRIHF